MYFSLAGVFFLRQKMTDFAERSFVLARRIISMNLPRIVPEEVWAMKRFWGRLVLFFSLLTATTPQLACASQVYGHLYFAEIMLNAPSGSFIDRQDQTRTAYFLGSLAPDSAWLAHMISSPQINGQLQKQYGISLPKNLRPVSSQLDDVHQVQPTKVSLQLLVAAEQLEDRAFAIGWLSHYVVDSYIHDLINHYGGFVVDPTRLDDPAMKLHDRLEALEMRHVLQVQGEELRTIAYQTRSAWLPAAFLRSALEKAYPQNTFYGRHPKYFLRTFTLAFGLMIDSTRWYGFQSEHSAAEIARMKRLIRQFRPSAGRVLSVLPDLPTMHEYRNTLVNGPFIADWNIRAGEIAQTSRHLMDNCAAYYWWRDRNNELGLQMSAEALRRIESEMRRINPRDNLMQPNRLRITSVIEKNK